MTEQTRVYIATIVGAVMGGMAGYMLFTEQGRVLRRQIEPALDDFVQELSHLRGTVSRAAGVASESWKLLDEALGDSGARGMPRYTNPHQTSPF